MSGTVRFARFFCIMALCWGGAVSASRAASITLKEYAAAGYTFAATADTQLDGHDSGAVQYNFGGAASYANTYGGDRPMLVRFDLGAIPNKADVIGVNAATLRLYRAGYQFNNVNLQLAQVAEDWVEGTSAGSWADPCDGAQWINRNAGTVVGRASFGSYGGGIYTIDGLGQLGEDPVNAGKKHIRSAGTDASAGNYNNSQNSFTPFDTLAALQAAGGTRGYYFDGGAGRLYLNRNDLDIRWYRNSDHWTTAGGTITGSAITDKTYPAKPTPAATWVEFNVKAIAQNWLLSGQGNYGVRVVELGGGGSTLIASEYGSDPTLRPELVLDLEYGSPMPAIQLSPTTLSFSGHAADPLPAAQSVTVQNSGVGTLQWTATVRAPAPTWISLANASGTDNGTFSVSINWQGMAAGTYTAYVDVADPNARNTPQTLTVTVQVVPPPQPSIQLSPASLTFSGHAADPLPATQSVTVQNGSGFGTLQWTAAVRAPVPAWLSLANASGTGNGTFSVSVDWQGLAAGTYTAHIDVTDANASNTPQSATVTMTVVPPPRPTLRVVPAVLVFTGLPTDPPPPTQTVTVQNTGSAASQWIAAARNPGPPEITLATPSGSDNGTFTVGVNWQGVAPGVYTKYIDVTDPNATNSPQTVTVTIQVRSQFDVSTHSFTNTSRGTHPNALTATSGSVNVNLAALPAGTQVFRAALVPQLSGSPAATSPLEIQSADAPGIWLQTIAPRHRTLDCTAAVQRALAGDGTLRLNVVSWPYWYGSGHEVRLDVWCDAPAAGVIQQVTSLQAAHRSGDTMLTFAEVNPPVTNPAPTNTELNNAKAAMDSPNEIRYRIYRSSQPIDGSTVRTAELIDEIAPMSGWNWTITVDTVCPLPIDDMTPSAPGTGIYVRRASAAGSAYYAISRAVNGEEDFSGWIPGVSSLAAPVAENPGTGMVLQYRQVGPVDWFFETGISRYYFVKWECPPNWNAPSYVHNYMVGVPSLQVSPRPVDVGLHCWGGNMEGGYNWWFENNNGALLVASNEDPYDWWTGFHENSGTIRPWTCVEGSGSGVVRNYSTKRVWSFVNDFVANRWTIDRNHILLSGGSMGGSGSSMWGIMAADKFAYINSWVGVHVPSLCDYFRGSYEQCWGNLSWNCLCEDSGQSVWDYWDTNQWLRNHVSTETPFITFSNGKNDAAIGWYQAYLYAKAMQETRRPHLFKWGQGGHNERAAMPGTLSDRYISIDIDKDKTLPAFTYCSLDENMGSGDPAVGDAAGMLNGYLLWKPEDSTDTAARWEMTCYLIGQSPAATCTVDITPRRCQAFRPAAGTICSWTNTDVATGSVIAAGTATVDANGLVTIPQATVGKTRNRIAVAIRGDINTSGHVDAADLLLLAGSWGKNSGQPGFDSRCDVDASGKVNVIDLLILADNWGK